MTTPRLGHAVTAVLGAFLGAALVLGISGISSGSRSEPVAPEAAAPSYVLTDPIRSGSSRLLLAWSPMGSGGLPVGTERTLEEMPVVQDATTVHAGLLWMRSSVSVDGAVVDDPPPGMGIPMEVAIVDPAEYARFVPPGERVAFASLQPGDAVIPDTEAALRGSSEGLKLLFEGARATVTDIVSDIGTNGYEVMMPPPAPPSLKILERFVLVHLRRPAGRAAVLNKLRGLLEPGQVLRVRAKGETPFLRYGDAVAPGMLVKRYFGEFAARPQSDGSITIERHWLASNIRTARLPILGAVTCHRALIPQLRRALREVRERGLGFLINEAQYGGCYGPRFISRDPRGRLSHHSWGIAIDLNVAENPFGTKADQDPRLIEIMESAGFTWGGRWLVPDGMHFEWARFP